MAGAALVDPIVTKRPDRTPAAADPNRFGRLMKRSPATTQRAATLLGRNKCRIAANEIHVPRSWRSTCTTARPRSSSRFRRHRDQQHAVRLIRVRTVGKIPLTLADQPAANSQPGRCVAARKLPVAASPSRRSAHAASVALQPKSTFQIAGAATADRGCWRFRRGRTIDRVAKQNQYSSGR